MKIILSDRDKTFLKVAGFVIGVIFVAMSLYISFPKLFPNDSLAETTLLFIMILVLYFFAYRLAQKEDYLGLKVFFVLMIIWDFLMLI